MKKCKLKQMKFAYNIYWEQWKKYTGYRKKSRFEYLDISKPESILVGVWNPRINEKVFLSKLRF